MHRLRRLVVIGAFAVLVYVVAAGPAVAAKGGNNDTAKVCQKGGWKALGAFANQGDCVNDGAQGSPPFGTAGKAACADVNGRFYAQDRSNRVAVQIRPHCLPCWDREPGRGVCYRHQQLNCADVFY